MLRATHLLSSYWKLEMESRYGSAREIERQESSSRTRDIGSRLQSGTNRAVPDGRRMPITRTVAVAGRLGNCRLEGVGPNHSGHKIVPFCLKMGKVSTPVTHPRVAPWCGPSVAGGDGSRPRCEWLLRPPRCSRCCRIPSREVHAGKSPMCRREKSPKWLSKG